MNRNVSLRTLLIIILIGAIIFGGIIIWITKTLSDSMSQLYAPIQKEQSYLNSF